MQAQYVYNSQMEIHFTSEQQAWLGASVARGEFASIEEAVRRLIDERMANVTASDEFAWVKHLVDEALMDEADGKVMPLNEHEARNDARLATLN